MVDVLSQMKETVASRNLFNPDSPVLLMVSGGSDSTAMAYLLKEMSDQGLVGPVAVLHVNHMLRGEAADGDEAFVAQLAEHLQFPLFSCQVDVAKAAEAEGGNIEAVGRRERYAAAREALKSLCLHTSCPISDGRILVAHTQDDRVENFFMRAITGTGPGGFRSMLYATGPIVRPVLDISRDQLRQYLYERAEQNPASVVKDPEGMLWREDATNAHTDHFRAFLRHEILPVAKQRNPKLLDTLCRTMNLIGDEDDMLDAQTAELMGKLVVWEDFDGDQAIDYEAGCLLRPAFGQQPVAMQRRVAFQVLQLILGTDARVENAAILAITDAFRDGAPVSGFTSNIQGNLALSANKYGLRIEPMSAYRARRK